VSHAGSCRLCANADLQAGKGTNVYLSSSSWFVEIGTMAFGRVSAKLATYLQPPSDLLPPGTRISLSTGGKPDHVMVQLAAPHILPDEHLTAPAIEHTAAPPPAPTTAIPQSLGQGSFTAAAQAASDPQQAIPVTEAAAERHGTAGSLQQREQVSSAAKRRKLVPVAEPDAKAGVPARLTLEDYMSNGGSAHAAAGPLNGNSAARTAAAEPPRRNSPPASPPHAPAASELSPPPSPPPWQKSVQPARQTAQGPAGEAHICLLLLLGMQLRGCLTAAIVDYRPC
jgi:hypothetical protein